MGIEWPYVIERLKVFTTKDVRELTAVTAQGWLSYCLLNGDGLRIKLVKKEKSVSKSQKNKINFTGVLCVEKIGQGRAV